MTDAPSIARQVLETWGASVVSVSTSLKEEADFLAELGGVRLLIEEKTKFEGPDRLDARNLALSSDALHSSIQPLGQNNRISGIVRKASEQLSSTGACVAHDLKVLWFTGVGFDAEARHLQLMSTLYGSTRIFELKKPYMRPCYFFRNSDFFRYREHFDGAVSAYLNGNTVTLTLCLNPYATSWEALRDSPFAKKFKFGLIDPVAEEAHGAAYIADTDMPRIDELAILRFLENKYGLEGAQNVDMSMTSVVMRVPKEG